MDRASPRHGGGAALKDAYHRPYEPRISEEAKAWVKQWGGTRKKVTGRLLDGLTWDQMPEMPQK